MNRKSGHLDITFCLRISRKKEEAIVNKVFDLFIFNQFGSFVNNKSIFV